NTVNFWLQEGENPSRYWYPKQVQKPLVTPIYA
ncbi:MAG: hypothetical protein ACI9Z7_001872, partial [Alteromonas macleodii]